ncbi:MAG: LacI family DNA-binding transcriptional regulator, partial [Verrucomicrobiota bacterium]
MTSPDSADFVEPPAVRRTIYDVAKAANVNPSTVSRVIQKSSRISHATREKVIQAMHRLGYVPAPEHRRPGNRLKAKQTGEAQVVCLVFFGQFSLHWIADKCPVYAYAIEGVRRAAAASGLHLVMRNASTSDALESLMKDVSVDGFIILGCDDADTAIFERNKRRPTVKLLGEGNCKYGDTVTANDTEIGQMAAAYLLGKGVRTAIMIDGAATSVTAIRFHCFRERIEKAGCKALGFHNPILDDFQESVSPIHRQQIAQILRLSLGANKEGTGIFVGSDRLLVALWATLQQEGWKPGESLPLISCNNERPYLRTLFPRPASMDIGADEIGSCAIQQLIWRIAHPSHPYRTI